MDQQGNFVVLKVAGILLVEHWGSVDPSKQLIRVVVSGGLRKVFGGRYVAG